MDGNVENAFPWLSATAYTPSDIPPTPGSIPPATPGLVIDPPRAPREGHEWVWYPDGFWAERELVSSAQDGPSSKGSHESKLRRWRGKSSKSQNSGDLDATPPATSRRGSGASRRGSGGSVGPFSPQPLHTPFRTEKELIQALQNPDGEGPLWGYPFGTVMPDGAAAAREGSARSGSSPASTVRGGGGGFRRRSLPETLAIPEEIGEVDESQGSGVGTPLARLRRLGKWKDRETERERRRSRSQESSGHPSGESQGSVEEPRSPQPSQTSMARKWFAKLRKKDSIDNSDSLSLIEEETFATPSSHTFWDSVYPGGEARRITTPPLKEATDGRVRSLFTELDNFTGEQPRTDCDNRSEMSVPNTGGSTGTGTPSSSSTSSTRWNSAYRRAATAAADGKGKHWSDSDADGDHKEQQKRHGRSRKKKDGPAFALNVPEHLPSSPLCPANPRHVSGGSGVCVFHGRKVDVSTKPKKAFIAELGMQQPTTESR